MVCPEGLDQIKFQPDSYKPYNGKSIDKVERLGGNNPGFSCFWNSNR
jgi:hypothetical protein